MNIQITNTNGQKYLMTGEELSEAFEKFVADGDEKGIDYSGGFGLSAFLFTYEEEPKCCSKCKTATTMVEMERGNTYCGVPKCSCHD